MYKFPFIDDPVSHEELFNIHGENPLFLRPADVERLYGIPVATVYELADDQINTKFPAFKMAYRKDSKRRPLFISKPLLDKWLIEHSNLTIFETNAKNN